MLTSDRPATPTTVTGLIFDRADIDRAHAHHDDAPFAAAWEMLRERQFTGLEAALADAFRFALDQNVTVGKTALTALAAHTPPPDQQPIDRLGDLVLIGQAAALLAAHPALTADDRAGLHTLLTDALATAAADPAIDTLPELIWLDTARMSIALVTGDRPTFEATCDAFRGIIADEVRPQGFIAKAVNGEDGGGMYRQVISSAGLVLMAEMATRHGVDLWGYQVRGVSVVTTAMYPMYYFYTTAKWKWDAGLQPEAVQSFFQRYGGYLEILHARQPHKDIQTVLDDLRPVYSPHAGGFTTLTHARPQPIKRRKLFGLF